MITTMKKSLDTSDLLKPQQGFKRDAKRHTQVVESTDRLKPAHAPYKKAKTNFKHFVQTHLDEISEWDEEF